MALEFHIKTHTLLHRLKSPFPMEENKSPTEEANFYLKYMNNPHLLVDLKRIQQVGIFLLSEHTTINLLRVLQ